MLTIYIYIYIYIYISQCKNVDVRYLHFCEFCIGFVFFNLSQAAFESKICSLSSCAAGVRIFGASPY